LGRRVRSRGGGGGWGGSEEGGGWERKGERGGVGVGKEGGEEMRFVAGERGEEVERARRGPFAEEGGELVVGGECAVDVKVWGFVALGDSLHCVLDLFLGLRGIFGFIKR
jgi:hypothetical protein